jgi:hypothetical protein
MGFEGIGEARLAGKGVMTSNLPFLVFRTIRSVQECVASGARIRGLFAVGGVNGFCNEYFDTSVHFLEPLEHLHANMSNLVAHVLHIMKCQQLQLPPGVTAPTLTDEVLPSAPCSLHLITLHAAVLKVQI